MSYRTSWNPLGSLRRVLLGAPIPTSKASHERLSPFLGLPVFSSDALSSVAYATEAILMVLILKANPGNTAQMLANQITISIGIIVLIAVVAFSYNQTIHAYPSGGGSYIVASENLGETAGLIAGAALLVDYVLTVSVSVAAGVAAIVSAYQNLHPYIVLISAACIGVVAWANLRGVKESGSVFAIPTYGFVIGLFILIAAGIYKAHSAVPVPQTVTSLDANGVSQIGLEASKVSLLFILLRAFAAGCTALTGIEAVSNGVQAFKAPEPDNASVTLRWMAGILAFLFLGIGYLALHIPSLTLHASANKAYETVVSQIAAWVFGKGSFPYLYIQYFTAFILILAANTAFADFPRLASLLARDGYLPRPLARQGDRLVFHNGIIALAVASGIIVWKFNGELDSLLPLYAVGVFTAFTLSQIGMVVHWFKTKEANWRQGVVINSFGAILTLIVWAIILYTKFTEGAWIVTILLAIQFVIFKAISSRYKSISKQLALGDAPPVPPAKATTILLVNRVHRGVLTALHYARASGLNVRAVHIAINRKALPEVQSLWEQYGEKVPLDVLNSPYRSLITPVLEYVDRLLENDPDQVVTVVVPEAYSNKWHHRILQESVASQLKSALGKRKNVVVTNVRYFLE